MNDKKKNVGISGMKKNDELTLEIEDMGVHGEGIGHVDGYALFVKGALPGETVLVRLTKLNKTFGFAHLLKVLKPSPHRCDSLCSCATACGGCTLQHLSYEGQLQYKEKKVRDCLIRIGGVDAEQVQWFPIIGMEGEEEAWHYRNKAQFPVREDRKGTPVAGFFAGRSHRLVPVSNCRIQHPAINEVVHCVLDFMREYTISAYREESHEGIIRHIYVRRGYTTGEIMVCLVIHADSLPYSAQLVESLKKIPGMTSICLNINRERTNVILGKETRPLWGPSYIQDTIGEIRYRISPPSFYQVNPVQTERLYQTVLDFADLQGNEMVWDLYCGIGTISLFLASKAQHVTGVEIVPEAVENAKENARLNGITNVDFHCGAAEEVAEKLCFSKSEKADVIVVDPPRKGCDAALLDTMIRMSPEKIVYVSCDPATLARDVKLLGEKGYQVEKVRPVDMFPQGGHVETIVGLHRRDT